MKTAFVITIAFLTWTPLAGQESLDASLERVGAYVTAFQHRLSNVVAEEHYVQDIRTLQPGRFASVGHRELRSDLLLVQPVGTDRYVAFRDVFEVDGRPVRDRQERLSRLFLTRTSSSDQQIQQINREGARYNIGNVDRTINTPTLALEFILPRNQLRFDFAETRQQTPALPGVRSTSTALVVEYKEVQRPTLIRGAHDIDLPVQGRFWIDRTTGRVSMSELVAEDVNVRAVIDVAYRWDDRIQLMVPAEMQERYDVRQNGTIVVGSANYARIRQFQVQEDMKAVTSDPAAASRSNEQTSGDSGAVVHEDRLDVSPIAATTSIGTLVETLPQPTFAQTPPMPTFRAGADLVRVDFVVTDRSDRPVQGLTAEDFAVKEDGKARPIVVFEAIGAGHGSTDGDGATLGAQPAGAGTAAAPATSTIVLIDDSHLTFEQAGRLRPALKHLLATVGERSGGLMLVSPASQISLVAERRTGAAALVSAIDRIVGQQRNPVADFPVGDAEALAIAVRDLATIARVASRLMALNPDLTYEQAETITIERGIELAHDVRERRNAFYEQAVVCLNWLSQRPGRRSLIVVSGGFPMDPDDGRYQEVITRSLQANAPIDFLDARGLSGIHPYRDAQYSTALNRHQDEGPFGRWDEAAGTMALADDTGGIVISNTNDLERGFSRLLDMMTSYYILAYEAPPNEKVGFHNIKVEAHPEGLHIRARRGYFTAKR